MPASLSPRPPEPEAEIGGKAESPHAHPLGSRSHAGDLSRPSLPRGQASPGGGVLQWTLPFWEEASAISVD